MPTKPKQFKAKQFLEAIPKSAGIISTIAERVGCTWGTCKKYITENPVIAEAYAAECERVLDLAETMLIKSIQAGDLAAVKFYLTTKGKVRGYVERQEHTGPEGGALTFVITERKNDANQD